jgi:hypothetical protein
MNALTIQDPLPNEDLEIDPRLKQLSYSSLLTLHSCPRRYQLYKCGANVRAEEDEESTTFAFGHTLGLGIQLCLEGKSEDEIFWSLFRGWSPDLFAEHEKRMESFWLAVNAVQKFIGLRNCGFLEEWELVYYEGKPACELSFVINFPDGFRYRGYVDAVLKSRITGAIAVLEVKSTGLNDIDESVYKNSAQAIGYSIVLDALFPELSSYDVLYLPYKKKAREFELRSYTKSYLQRALWIQELLLDIESIKMYATAGVYPMHGESCYDFYRQCEYFNLCTLSNEHLLKQIDQKTLDKLAGEEYTVNLSLMDLLDSQLAKDA